MLFTSCSLIPVQFPQGYTGHEDCILNLDDRLLFSWELIFRFLAEFTRPISVTYNSFWEVVMDVYIDRGLITIDMLQSLLNLRSKFQDAVVSTVILFGIDYSKMMCDCNGDSGLVLDGTQVAMKSVNSLLEQAWRVPFAGDTPKEPTSSADLVFLDKLDKKTRALALKFVRNPRRFDKKKHSVIFQDAGLTDSEYKSLLDLTASSEHEHVKLLHPLFALPTNTRTTKGSKRIPGLFAFPRSTVWSS